MSWEGSPDDTTTTTTREGKGEGRKEDKTNCDQLSGTPQIYSPLG